MNETLLNASPTLMSIIAANSGVLGHHPGRAGLGLGGHATTTDRPDLVTLPPDWSRVVRLLVLASFAVIGSVGNVFMISSIMVEDHLRKKGNAFLVNIALADLLVSGLVIPVSAVVILAGQQETTDICRFEWTFINRPCFLVTVLTHAAIAIENYMRLCLPIERYNVLTSARITTIILLIWVVAGLAVSLQSYLGLGPDFCERRFNSVPTTTEAIGASLLVVLPVFITLLTNLRLILNVRRVLRGSFKPPLGFLWDYELVKANVTSSCFFIIFWLPLGVLVCLTSSASQLPGSPVSGPASSAAPPARGLSERVYVYLAWFALSKSCFNNFLYCIADRHFRTAYVKLFHYCCCKTTVSFSRRPRADPGRCSAGETRHGLRVHIMQSYTSPAGGRPAVARPNGREVYEL